jgi:predicted oxidoreductase
VDENLVNAGERTLGPFTVGPLAYGCWRLVAMSTTDATARIEAALAAGMNLIDNADVYGLDWGGTHFGMAEELLGEVLAGAPDLRDHMVVATKGGIVPPVPYDSSHTALIAACEASLRRLQVERIDLYQIHRPDLFTHPGEVAAALGELHDSGKIGAVGVSNYTVAQHRALAAHLPFPIVSTQPQYSAHHLEPLRDGTLDAAMELSTAVLAWSPLAGGALATGDVGKVRPELVATLDRLAEREGVDRAAIAVAFVLAHPSAPVAILGTQDLARIATSRAALGVTLTRNDVYDIIEASEGVPLP